MRTKTMLAAALAILFAMAGATYAADMAMPGGVKMAKVADGKTTVLTDSKGMTLYTFDADKAPGKSACNGQCATYWPPLAATADSKPTGDWSVVTRDDGSKQWAWKGKPLYTFMNDKKPGETTGNNMPANNPMWHCAVVT